MIIFVSGTYIISQQQMYKFVISDKVYIACDTSSAPVTLYMPKITQEFMNVQFYISDGSSNAASNNITILPNGTDLINGGASIDITSNDGCCVLTTASTSDVNNDILSPQSIWIASSSQSGGGGGSYTANNGLNLAGTTFKLGGTLSQNTSINNNGFDLDIYSNTPTTSGALLDLNLNAIGTAFQSTALNGFGVRSMSFSGINLESLSYDDYTALFIRETSSVNDAIGVLKIVRNTTGTAFGGIGGSIDFWIEPRYTGTPPPGSPTEPTVRLAGLWENPGPNVASRLSRLDFYGYSGGAGNVLNASVRGDGFFSLYQYGLGTFVGTPAYSLGIDASGNVVEFVGGGGTTPSAPFKSIQFNNSGAFGGDAKYILETSPIFNGVPAPANSLAIQLESSDNSFTTQTIRSLNNGGSSLANLFMQNGVGTSAIQHGILLFNGAWTGNSYIRNSSVYSTVLSDVANTNAAKQLFFIASSNANSQFEWHYNTINSLVSTTRLMTLASNGRLNLAKYGVNTFAGSPTYSLGVDASGNVVEFVGGGGGNANITYLTEAQLFALELAGNLSLTTLYVVTDTPNFQLMCKAERLDRISPTATVIDIANGVYSGSATYVSRDSSIATRIGSIVINDNSSSTPANANQWFGVLPSAWALGSGCRRNTFYSLSSGTLGGACQINTFHQASFNNVLGNGCEGNTFYQGAGDNTLGGGCSSNIFEQQAQQNVLGNACLYNKFELNANLNTLSNSCESNIFGVGSSGNTLGVATGGCIGNRFYFSSGNQLGDDCSYNTFDASSDNNILGDSCVYNAFQQQAGSNQLGIGCSNNMFEQRANSNTLGDGCQYNKFQQRANTNLLGLNCSGNTFGISSSQNSIGDNCSANTFAQDTSSNVLGINSLYNTFEQGANNNILGDDATSNTFGQLAASNVLGNLCGSNTFKASAVSNTLLDQCNFNLFGENCQGNSIGLSGTSNTFHQGCNNNALSDSCISNIFFQDAYDNILGDSCSYNTFEQAAGFNTLGDTCSNNTFKQGVNSWVFGANLLNVTIEGTATGLNVTSPSYAFLYGNTTPSTISYDSANAQWYHQYYDTSTSAWITTNL